MEKKKPLKKMTKEEIEAITEIYDSIDEETRIRIPKPKGYRKPDMEIPKWRKPRRRKHRKFDRKGVSGKQVPDIETR